MRKIIKQEFKEDKNGFMYELTQLEETTTYETDDGDEEHTKHTLVIMKSPLKNDVGEITDNTKSLIDKISKGGCL